MDLSSKPNANYSGRNSDSISYLSYKLWSKSAEWVAALGGALFIGGIVGVVNAHHGLDAALLAGAKQALWTALIAGLLTRFCRFLCTQTKARLLPPMVCGVLCPSLLAVLGVSVVHHLDGTANPWGSIMVTVIMAPPGFWLVAHNIRRYEAATATQVENKSAG